jgi:hypothetical protein
MLSGKRGKSNPVPYKLKVAELDLRIADATASIGRQRTEIVLLRKRKTEKRTAEAKLEKLLGALARMRAERVRLIDRQGLISN